tara:strand:+ start:407 stop:622 length:216 start_codon:yes stop_codon:yes gene_type:complete
MRGTYSDMARRGSTNSSTPPAVVSQPEPESTETVKSKPAKSFLKDFVDKIPDPVKDSISEQFGGMIGMVEK